MSETKYSQQATPIVDYKRIITYENKNTLLISVQTHNNF